MTPNQPDQTTADAGTPLTDAIVAEFTCPEDAMIEPSFARKLEQQLADTRRRLAEVENERDDWRKESDANARFIADLVRDGITRAKLTALRNAADGESKLWEAAEQHWKRIYYSGPDMSNKNWAVRFGPNDRRRFLTLRDALSALIAEGAGK